MFSEAGQFFLAMSLGFASLQTLASFWGVSRNRRRWLALGHVSATLQAVFIVAAFVTLMGAFLFCDFSLLAVALHDHTDLPWFYRLAASWGNHEGSLLLFTLILSSLALAQSFFIKDPDFRGRVLTFQGGLIVFFLLFMITSSSPFTALPLALPQGKSLNPLLQDQGLLFHPPLLYFGYGGFSAPFAIALAALWGTIPVEKWAQLARPWVLIAWAALTGGITLGSWWAYYELGWGGWWFWDPVENVSLMPWLAGTALLHTLRTGSLYRWSLFLSLLTFGLCLLGTFLVRSGLLISVHSFAQDPERGLFILRMIALIMGFSFFFWMWKGPRLQSRRVVLMSRQGTLLVNSLILSVGLATLLIGTLYPLASDFLGGEKLAVGAPYFERTLIPLMLPLFLLIPIGALLRDPGAPFLSQVMPPLTATLGGAVLVLYLLSPASLWALSGILLALWVFLGSLKAYFAGRLNLGPTLAHLGVAIALLGVSVAGGFRTETSQILGPHETMSVDGTSLTLETVEPGKTPTYHYEKAILTHDSGVLTPEKRLYHPQEALLSETAIWTNGFKDLYVILGPYQGEGKWLFRATSLPLAPWIWLGGAIMVLGACISFFYKRASIFLLFLLLPQVTWAASPALYEEVRCPVCLGQSIADSDTEEAEFLKSFISDRVKAGQSEAEIRNELRRLYGDDILFRPPLNVQTLFLWGGPFVLFFLMGLGLFLKRRAGQSPH